MEKINNCPICSSDDLLLFMDVKDHMISGESFSLKQCNTCSFIFTNPRPDASSIGKYYESDAYISHSGTKKGMVNRLYHLAQFFTLNRKYRLVQRISKGNTLLDYGCGTGLFLQYCQQRHMHVAGIEPMKSAREICQKDHGLSVWSPDHIDDIPGTYDVITMWHVLEHIHDLDAFSTKVIPKLKPGGKLIVAVPNAQSIDADNYHSFWAAWDVPRHLYHFTPKTLALLFNNRGFQLTAFFPMHLDAFYVSLLSEKYRNSKLQILRGFLSGMKTFLKANKKNKKYSSIIYIFHQI